MNLTLHPATFEDLPRASVLLAKAVPNAYAQVIAVAQPGYVNYLHDRITEGKTHVYVAKAGYEVVGAAEFRLIPDGLFLNAIWVEPAYRGMRIGHALMDRAAADVPCPALWLDVDEDNVRAHQGYLQQGFVETGRSYVGRLSFIPPPQIPPLGRIALSTAEKHAFLRYGFCTLRLGDEQMGLMGRAVLRASSPLSAQALGIAKWLFPRRTLWCFGPRGEATEHVATLIRLRRGA